MTAFVVFQITNRVKARLKLPSTLRKPKQQPTFGKYYRVIIVVLCQSHCHHHLYKDPTFLEATILLARMGVIKKYPKTFPPKTNERHPVVQSALQPGIFDYIIVGAGPSAMGLLMGLLEAYSKGNITNNSPPSIAIVERGPHLASTTGSDTRRSNLNSWFEASHNRSSPHVTVLQTDLAMPNSSYATRLLDVPIGRGVGGGSNINAGLCVAPPPEDFQDWPEPWKTNLPASLAHLQETLVANHCLWNATNSKEITTQEQVQKLTSSSSSYNETKKGFFNTVNCLENVVPCLAKFNSHNQQIERANYYQGLLEPLLEQPSHMNEQIHWFCDREAQRLMFQANRVTGVELWDPTSGIYITLHAQKEVILCLGALETPALLMVSGIGPENNDSHDSYTANTKPKHVVSAVGQNLRDHVILPRVLLSPPPAAPQKCINGIHSMTPFAIQHDKFLLMTSTTVPEIALHFFTRILQRYWWELVSTATIVPSRLASLGWKVLEGLVQLVVLYSPVYWILKYAFTTMNLAHVNPGSTGSLRLKPKRQQAQEEEKRNCFLTAGQHHSTTLARRQDFDIQLDPAYVRDPQDVEALWQGWVASPMISAASFANRWEIYPGILFRYLYGCFSDRNHHAKVSNSAPWFSQFARDTSLPFFHWCGTCAIKTSNGSGSYRSSNDKRGDDWVVDADLKVRSLESLRICDASIFPNNLSVPPALACAAAGHFLGGILLMETNKDDC